MRDLRNERVVRVWVRQHGANRQQHLRDRQCRAPLIPENVEADASIRVDVGVIDPGREVDLRRLEGIVGRKMNGQEKDAPSVR